MALHPSFVKNAATTPLDARLADLGTVVQNADGSARTGILGYLPNLVTPNANMTVNVAAAGFVLSKSVVDGVTRPNNDGTVAVTVATAPIANSRIDVVWVKHFDSTTGDSSSLPLFGVSQGTAAASPGKPGIPTGALELATVVIPANVTSLTASGVVVTNTARMTAMSGGIVPFRTIDELNNWTSAQIGQYATVGAGLETYRWGGSAWRPLADPISVVTGVMKVGGAAQPLPGDLPLIRRYHYVEALTSGAGLVPIPTWPGGAYANGILKAEATTVSGAGVNPVINAGQVTKTGGTFVFPGVNNTNVAFVLEIIGW
jgi:hypothetical protein